MANQQPNIKVVKLGLAPFKQSAIKHVLRAKQAKESRQPHF